LDELGEGGWVSFAAGFFHDLADEESEGMLLGLEISGVSIPTESQMLERQKRPL